jgi:hypothetical protein
MCISAVLEVWVVVVGAAQRAAPTTTTHIYRLTHSLNPKRECALLGLMISND